MDTEEELCCTSRNKLFTIHLNKNRDAGDVVTMATGSNTQKHCLHACGNLLVSVVAGLYEGFRVSITTNST